MSSDEPAAKRGSTPTTRTPKLLPTRRNHCFPHLCLQAAAIAPSFRWTHPQAETRYAPFAVARRRSQRGAPRRPFRLFSSPSLNLTSTWRAWKESLTLRGSNRPTIHPSPRSRRQARVDSAWMVEHPHAPRLLPRVIIMAAPCLVTHLYRAPLACVAARALSTITGCHHIPLYLL
jgi:hypothetical protein